MVEPFDAPAQVFLDALAAWLQQRADPRVCIRGHILVITELREAASDFCLYLSTGTDLPLAVRLRGAPVESFEKTMADADVGNNVALVVETYRERVH